MTLLLLTFSAVKPDLVLFCLLCLLGLLFLVEVLVLVLVFRFIVSSYVIFLRYNHVGSEHNTNLSFTLFSIFRLAIFGQGGLNLAEVTGSLWSLINVNRTCS